MDNEQVTPVSTEADAEVTPVVSDLDAKVSTDEAQRKTAIWVQIFYTFCYLMVGLILGVYAIVWLANPVSMHTESYDDLTINSFFAMGIVGMALIIWGIVSLSLSFVMQMKNKQTHHLSNAYGIMAWLTLNPYTWSLIRQSNGYLSKKQKEKIAKKAAAAQSTDSVDVKSDAEQDASANAAKVN